MLDSARQLVLLTGRQPLPRLTCHVLGALPLEDANHLRECRDTVHARTLQDLLGEQHRAVAVVAVEQPADTLSDKSRTIAHRLEELGLRFFALCKWRLVDGVALRVGFADFVLLVFLGRHRVDNTPIACAIDVFTDVREV